MLDIPNLRGIVQKDGSTLIFCECSSYSCDEMFSLLECMSVKLLSQPRYTLLSGSCTSKEIGVPAKLVAVYADFEIWEIIRN